MQTASGGTHPLVHSPGPSGAREGAGEYKKASCGARYSSGICKGEEGGEEVPTATCFLGPRARRSPPLHARQLVIIASIIIVVIILIINHTILSSLLLSLLYIIIC